MQKTTEMHLHGTQLQHAMIDKWVENKIHT